MVKPSNPSAVAGKGVSCTYIGVAFALATSPKHGRTSAPVAGFDSEIQRNGQAMMEEGKKTFRYDTFGDEAFWGDALQLHKAVEGEKHGGVGAGVNPKTALAVGLKVDVDALPAELQSQLKAGKVDLDDPATTLALLKLNAVVGVTGHLNADGSLKSMGLQCAFCHSTVDNSLAPASGIASTVGRTETSTWVPSSPWLRTCSQSPIC